jgi:hypothetical protein
MQLQMRRYSPQRVSYCKSWYLAYLPSYLPRFWACQLNSAVSALVSERISAYLPLDLELQTIAYFTERQVTCKELRIHARENAVG